MITVGNIRDYIVDCCGPHGIADERQASCLTPRSGGKVLESEEDWR